jgi:hypothetical protein
VVKILVFRERVVERGWGDKTLPQVVITIMISQWFDDTHIT